VGFCVGGLVSPSLFVFQKIETKKNKLLFLMEEKGEKNHRGRGKKEKRKKPTSTPPQINLPKKDNEGTDPKGMI